MPAYPPPAPDAPAAAPPHVGRTAGARRAGWLKTLHQWHWISSALCLAGMLLFAVTGITLNHSGAIEARPQTTARQAVLPDALLAALQTQAAELGEGAEAVLPAAARQWAAAELAVRVGERPAEWSAEEIYLALPRPGGDAWLRFDLQTAEAEYELTERGWIAWANDLHKGRNSGTAWSWFIDLFAVACVVFSLTGLLILQAHAANRPAVWPVTGLGLVLPLLLIILFIH
jgi:uncharacterized protein